MKTKRFAFTLLIGVLTTALFVFSCKKDETDNDTTVASDNAVAEKIFGDVNTMADQASKNGSLNTFIAQTGESTLLSNCAIITLDTVTNPRRITIDFGNSNCLCNDGRFRRGKVIVTYTGWYRDSGTVINYSFDNYFVNDYQVTNASTKTVTNKGRKTNGNLWYTISESGSIIKPNNGGTITWASNREREWVAGSTTLLWYDDVYLLTGTASGSSSAGTAYTLTITKALRIELNCHNVVSGTIDILLNGKTYTLDYGTGTCDNLATVLINGKTYTITLN